MSDFKEIIDYLEVFRNEALSKSQLVAKVDFDFDENSIFEEELISVNKQDLLTNSKFYYNLESNIYDQGLKTLYLQPQNSGNVFYYKKIEFSQNNTFITKYKRVPDYFSDQLEDLDENTLTPINITSTKGYYYDQKNDIIIYANILNNTTVTNDVFSYAPNDLSLQSGSHIIDEGDLQNNKNFSIGYYIGNKELVDRDINTFNVINREVNLFKNTKSGLVNLFPSLNNKTLVYAYYEKGIPVTSFLAKNNPAISLSFKNHLILLEFLNHTIFYEFDNLDQFSNGDRNKFLKGYISYIEVLINQNRKNFLDTLQILYYIPAYVLKVTGYTFLWNLLDRAILAGFVTEDRNAKKESFLIHILEGLYESYYDKSFFMLHLLNTIQGKTRLEHLHYRIDTENNVKLVQLLFKAWKKTRFVKPDIEKNPEFKITNGPVFLPYDSQKWAGFYFSNANVNFEKQTIEVELETGKKVYEPIRRKTEDGVWVDDVKEKEIKENYNYHPLYPIYIKNIEKQDTTIAFESIIPAFLLYVNENKAWWNNFVKTGEYVVDVLTISSGFASLKSAKYFANIARMAQTAESVSGAEKVAEAANILKNIKNASGVVEISSSSVNIMLKITELDETEFGQNLSKVLFYLELLTLAGELTIPMKANLKKSAKEVIHTSDGALRKKYPELFTELYKIIGFDDLGRKLVYIVNYQEIGKQGNKIIFKLVDHTGNEIGELIRGIGIKGRSTKYQLIIKGKKIDLNSEITLYNAQMGKSNNLPIKAGEEILYADINIPTKITQQYSGLGEIMLDESLAYFNNNVKFGKVDGNFGYWVKFEEYYKDYGGQSINLKQFWQAVDAGKPYEEAAFETFTGKWAEKNGFTKIVINDVKKDISKENVIIKFIK
ncbi:hypothetical protein [Flavobacterium sp. U410]